MKTNKYIKYANCRKKSRSALDNLYNHNECNNRKTKTRPLKYLHIFCRCRKMLWQLWLKDSLIEGERIGYNKNDINMLYKINKTTEIVVDTAIWNTESIEITEVVKQG